MATNALGRMPKYGEALGFSPSDEPAFPVALPRLTAPTGDDSIPPEGYALLEAISGPESAGRWNVRYDGTRNGATFSDFSRHPRVFETITSGPRKGDKSSAAGKFQITATTYDRVAPRLGITDFSPASQQKIAWYLAQEAYGPNLVRDLQAGKFDQIATKLSPVWDSLPAGGEPGTTTSKFAAAYQRHLGHPVPPADIPATGAPMPADRVRVAELRDQYASANAPQPKTLPANSKAAMIRAGLPAPAPLVLPPITRGTTTVAGDPRVALAPGRLPTALETAKQKLELARQRQAARTANAVRPEGPASGMPAAPRQTIAETLGGKPPAGITRVTAPASGSSFAQQFGNRVASVEPSVRRNVTTITDRGVETTRAGGGDALPSGVVPDAIKKMRAPTAPVAKDPKQREAIAAVPEFITVTKRVLNPEYTKQAASVIKPVAANDLVMVDAMGIPTGEVGNRNVPKPAPAQNRPKVPQFIEVPVKIPNPAFRAAPALAVPHAGAALGARNFVVPAPAPTGRVAQLRALGYSPSGAYSTVAAPALRPTNIAERNASRQAAQEAAGRSLYSTISN